MHSFGGAHNFPTKNKLSSSKPNSWDRNGTELLDIHDRWILSSQNARSRAGKQPDFRSTYVCRLQTSTNGEYWDAETTGEQRHSGAMSPAFITPSGRLVIVFNTPKLSWKEPVPVGSFYH
jgi:hypothetical protein